MTKHSTAQESFEHALGEVKNLGELDAFIIVTKAKKDDNGPAKGVCACYGGNIELAELYDSIPEAAKLSSQAMKLMNKINEISKE